ncbi:MAG: response regulator, partial [Candidatus Angelobacter sp.]
MSLRILFADDSMTAQNMGKKILTEAGYEVVAVSNGAAAVKKIAEQKPDIIILDVYMPGYSGLEVCEKVRGSLDTMKTPVLLTVGKMEPYKPEDANRVKADGVIIKPFEASDLLAIMKKFEERIAQTAVPPMAQQTVRLEREYQEDAIAAAEPVEHHSTGKTGMQPMVEVPDHMAGSAAFNDMLGADSSIAPHHFGVSSPAAAFETSVIVPAPPIPTAEYELP